MLKLIQTAIFTYIATESDDFIIFISLYSTQNKRKACSSHRTIICTYNIIFYICFFSILASKLPYKAICFMGFIPLIIGIKSIFGKSETYKKKRNYF